MIRIITGHLACGRWRLKQVDGVYFLAHPQPFSRRSEFRIGPDQVTGVEVEKSEPKQILVKILFTDPTELAGLQSMVNSQSIPPLAKDQTQNWIKGLIAFFILCTLFELLK